MPGLDLSALQSEVEANPTVDGSLIALVNLYIAQVEDLKTQIVTPADQAKVQALADSMKSQREQSVLFVTNNTPAQTQPPTVPGPGETAGVDQQQAEARARVAQRTVPPGGTPR